MIQSSIYTHLFFSNFMLSIMKVTVRPIYSKVFSIQKNTFIVDLLNDLFQQECGTSHPPPYIRIS